MSKAFSTHIPLNSWQKALLGAASGLGCALNPHRADLVAASNEILGEPAFNRMHQFMLNSPNGKQILTDKPLITRETLQSCREMEKESFGLEYAHFMDSRNFSPEDRPPVRFIDNPEVAYVALRYRQVHDLWHVLTACPTNMSGEIAVKIIEAIQTGLPNTVIAGLLSPLLIKSDSRREYFNKVLPWAIRTGFNASDLMCIYYERHFTVSDYLYTRSLTVAGKYRRSAK